MTDFLLFGNNLIIIIGVILGFVSFYYTHKVVKILGRHSIWMFYKIAIICMLIHRIYVLTVVVPQTLTMSLFITSVLQAVALGVLFVFAYKLYHSLKKDFKQ